MDHSLSATSKVMPLHPGNRRPRIHRTPKKSVRRVKSGESSRAAK